MTYNIKGKDLIKHREDRHQAINILLHKLRTSKRVIVLTGAGISQASGLPTYRDVGGLWLIDNIDEIGTRSAFLKDPVRVINYWKLLKLEKIDGAKPNTTHAILALMEKYYQDFLIITQNIDGLHHKAGNKKVLEIHGSLLRTRIENGIERPDIVLFDEDYSTEVYDCVEQYLHNLPDLILEVGTSNNIIFPTEFVKRMIENKVYVAEFNLGNTRLTNTVNISIQDKCEESLYKIWKRAMENS